MSGLSCGFGFEFAQSLNVGGGCTVSVFPKVEEFLNENGDHQKALQYVAAMKKMNVYHSVMDFLFCEIYTEQRRACRKYYDGKGLSLKDMATKAQIAEWETILLQAVKMALRIHEEKRRISWTVFRIEVRRAAA